MNAIKKLLGIVWMAIGAYAVYYLIVYQAIDMYKAGGEKMIPFVIYTFVLCPMIAGALGAFGLYSLQGEYDQK